MDTNSDTVGEDTKPDPQDSTLNLFSLLPAEIIDAVVELMLELSLKDLNITKRI